MKEETRSFYEAAVLRTVRLIASALDEPLTHRGAYSGLGDAWARLMGVWLPQSGHRVRNSPSYEVYVSDPRTTPTNDLQTDLYLPLVD